MRNRGTIDNKRLWNKHVYCASCDKIPSYWNIASFFVLASVICGTHAVSTNCGTYNGSLCRGRISWPIDINVALTTESRIMETLINTDRFKTVTAFDPTCGMLC